MLLQLQTRAHTEPPVPAGLRGVVTGEPSWLLLNIAICGASLSLVDEGPSSPS